MQLFGPTPHGLHIQLELALRPVTPQYSETLPAFLAMYADRPVEDTPYLRLAAALIRSAIKDIRGPDHPDLVNRVESIAAWSQRVRAGTRPHTLLVDAHAHDLRTIRDDAIDWFNSAKAPIPFPMLAQELGVRPHVMRAVVAGMTGMQLKGKHDFLHSGQPDERSAVTPCKS